MNIAFLGIFVFCDACLWSVSLSAICNDTNSDANTSLSFSNPFVSVWKHMEAQTTGPFYICHNLGVDPVNVEVQVKVQTQNNGEQIFSGVGSAQRDDDLDVPYGGIVYLYNSKHVILFVPKNSGKLFNTDRGTLVYTGYPAFKGAFIGNYTKAEVRIKAWNLQGLSTIQFETSVQFSRAQGYLAVLHNIGILPSYVTAQVKFEKDGISYISEAEGANFHSYRLGKLDSFGGVVYAYNDTYIRLWTPKKGFLFYANDGWGTDAFKISNGTVTIRAWTSNVVISEHYFPRDVRSDDSNDEDDHIIEFDQSYDVDKYIIAVQINTLEPENNNYVFHGVGTALKEGSFGNYGGVIYAYNQTHVLLWTPSERGYMAYLGGEWTSNAEQTIASSRAKVSSQIINLSDSPRLCSRGEIVDVVGVVHMVNDTLDMSMTGTNVTYKCRGNHRLVSGDLNRTCMSNGRWSGQTPVCKRCHCPCSQTRQQISVETKQKLESTIATITTILTVKKSDLSSQTRKKISAKDTRASATSLGGVLGLGIILIIALSIVISDLPLIVEHIRNGPHNRNKKII